MSIRLLEDLRFVIGLFFLVLSVILIALGIINPESYPDGLRLNLWAGIIMAIFALTMLGLSIYFPISEDV